MDCFYKGESQSPGRTIASIWSASGASGYIVGRDGVDVITIDHAHGQMADVPWFAVYKGDCLAYRVNAAHVSRVVYVKEQHEKAKPC